MGYFLFIYKTNMWIKKAEKLTQNNKKFMSRRLEKNNLAVWKKIIKTIYCKPGLTVVPNRELNGTRQSILSKILYEIFPIYM